MNDQHHNPFDCSDYCPFCGFIHVIDHHPRDGETRGQYDARMDRLRAEWDEQYRIGEPV